MPRCDNPQMAKSTTRNAPGEWRKTYLREWREWKGLKLGEMSDLTGINEGHLSSVERSGRRYNQDILEAYSKIIEVPNGYLLDRRPPAKGEAVDYSDPAMIAYLLEQVSDPKNRRRVAELVKGFVEDADEAEPAPIPRASFS